MTVIIIEDEPLIAAAIEKELRKADPTIEVPIRLGSIAGALDYFSENSLPDLFFSDIQLNDGLSFEIFRALKSTVPVIFCTAFSEFALEAFRQNGIDYLLKPIEPAKLRATLAKYNNLMRPADFRHEDLARHFGQSEPRVTQQLLISRADKIIPLKKADIGLFLLSDGIVWCHTFDGQRYATEVTLEELERELDDSFYRANRQTIIHRKSINEVKRHFARKLLINPKVKGAEAIIISKAKSRDFLLWLAQ